jgi:transcription initiation factor TFIIIB Brf1 subunit/transcription initiation factor TFIIB
MEKCEYCNSSDFITDNASGDIICENCGIIFTTIINQDDESMHYANTDGDPSSVVLSRCGNIIDSVNPFDNGQNNMIPKGFQVYSIDAHGHEIKRSLYRFNTSLTYSAKHQAFYKMSLIMNSMETTLSIYSTVIDTAKSIFGEFMKTDKIIRDHVRLGFMASCVYVACKFHNTERTVHEIALSFSITTADFYRGYNIMYEFLIETPVLEPLLNCLVDVNSSTTAFMKLSNFCQLLNLSFSLEKECLELDEQYRRQYFANVMMKTIHAAIIHYVITSHTLSIPTRQEICTITNVSNTTLNKTVKELKIKIILNNK